MSLVLFWVFFNLWNETVRVFLFAFEVFLQSKAIYQFYIIINFLHNCWKFSSTACIGVYFILFYLGGGSFDRMSEVHFQNDKILKWVDRVGFTCTYSLLCYDPLAFGNDWMKLPLFIPSMDCDGLLHWSLLQLLFY